MQMSDIAKLQKFLEKTNYHGRLNKELFSWYDWWGKRSI